MGKKELEEVKKGLDMCINLVANTAVLWIILDILPHLPDELGKRVADKLLGALGL